MGHHHQPLYRFVLRDALEITWRNKFLWFLGFFVALLGNGGAYDVALRGLDRATIKIFASGGDIPNIFSVFLKIKNLVLGSASARPIVSFVLLTLLFIVIAFLYFLFSSSAMSASIVAVGRLASGGKTTLLESLGDSLPHIPHVFGINVLAKIFTSALLGFSVIPLGWFLVRNQVAFGFLYVIVFTVLISLGLLISFLGVYAACSSIFGKRHIFSAVGDGFRVFSQNAVISIEMALILFFINIISTLALVVVLISLAGLLGFGLTLLATAKLAPLFWAIFGIGAFTLGAALILTGSFLGAFQLASWTLLYAKLVRGGVTAKVVRLASRVARLVRPVRG